ncbi:MAG: AAA family ATPase [Phycisphaerales bacterium]|nr:AAA family ATPase [Phycisphaerales bacterium]
MSTAPIPPGQRSRPMAAPQRRPTIDPVRVVRQHIVGLLASLIIGGFVGAAAFLLFGRLYPLFSSEVLFEVRPGLAESTDIGTAEALKDEEVERVARTQTALLMQRDVLSTALESPAVVATNWMQTWFIDPTTGQPQVAQAVDELEDTLRTPVLRGTNLFAIRWSWHVATDVPVVLDAVAASYIRKLKRLDDQQFASNETVFREQERLVLLALQDIGEQINSFIVEKGITTLDDPRFSQAALEVEALATSLAESQRLLTSAKTQYQQTAMKVEGTMEPTEEDEVEAHMDPTLVQQFNRLEILRAEERSLREKFNEDTPQVRQIERQVRGLTEQIRLKEEELLQRNLTARMRTLSSERERLEKVISSLENELEAKDGLLRDLAADTSQYQYFKTQRENLELQRDESAQLLRALRLMKLRSDASRVRQVGPAELPREPSFPRAEIVIPGGVLVCFAGYLGWIFLRELTEKRVRSIADLAVIPGVTVLGAVADIDDDPAEPEDAELILAEHPSGVTAESVRQLATVVLRGMSHQGHSTLMVAGGMPGAGTTTLCGNLALAIVAKGHSVCMVDANFRRPYAGEMFGLSNDATGLGDLLAGSSTIDEAAIKTASKVAVVPAGTVSCRLPERLDDERLAGVLAELRTRFDYVLIDVAPAVAASDATQVAMRSDAAILVVRANQEERGLIARLARELNEASAEFLGAVLNRPRQAIGGYFRRNYEVMASYGQEEEDDQD